VNQGVNQVMPGINWKTGIEGDAVVVETDAGSLTTENNQFQVRDNQGNIVAASARPSSLLQYVVRQEAFDDAVGAAGTQFGIITVIGTLVGTLTGGLAGCAIGGVGGLVPGIPVLALGGATGVAKAPSTWTGLRAVQCARRMRSFSWVGMKTSRR
jgi:hypothetical protein